MIDVWRRCFDDLEERDDETGAVIDKIQGLWRLNSAHISSV